MGPQDPAVARVRRVIERLSRDGTVVARSDGSRHELFPVAVDPVEGAALRDLVRREGATMTLEIGLGYGMSALHVCEALVASGASDARHVVVDPHQATRFADCGLQVLEEAGCAHLVEHHAQESLVALARMLEQGQRFDLAVVDGNHRFDGVLVDLVYLGRLVRPGGVVFLDDHQLPGVARAVSFFTRNRGWIVESVERADADHEWAIVRTATEPDTRPFDHFVDF